MPTKIIGTAVLHLRGQVEGQAADLVGRFAGGQSAGLDDRAGAASEADPAGC